ncbi:RDD family protein [Clostridium perfringens]|uniref:RDD family protein n=1 Tax=Clostridium perfringens TaxID=1502 RepID=UPI0013E37FD2|nr:RDD family protein [Clostridium perfringens]NGT56971.1 RDD family protein [Clostridium perfringens]NGT95620.1 RDD family protein [Clostridium perfringens]
MDDNKFTKEQENALKSDETSVTNEKMDSYEKEAAVLDSISLDTNTMAIDEEFMNKQDKDKKDIGEKGEKETSFFKRLLEGSIDQTVVLLLSLAAFFIVDLLMRPFGYKISLEGRIPFYFVIFVIMNILYRAIMEGRKFKLTLGEKVFRK